MQLSMKYPANYTNVAAENLSFFCSASSFRAVDYQQSTVQNLRSGGHTSSFHRRGQWSEGSLLEDQVPKSTRDDGEEVPAQALDAHSQDLQECKPRSRNCVSGEVKLSSSAQALEKSSTIKARPWVSGELKSISTRPYRVDDRLKSIQCASATRSVCTRGLERASSCNLRGGADYGDLNKLQLLRRRPSASIAWDSLNESREDNLMRQVAAAVPFKWEEAPAAAAAHTASPQNQANCRAHLEEQEPPEQLKSSFVKLKQKILKLLREILRLIRRPKSQKPITIGIMLVAAAASEAAAGTTHA